MDPDSSYQLLCVVFFVLLASFLMMGKTALKSLNKKKYQLVNSEEKNPKVLLANKIMEEHPDLFVALCLAILTCWFVVASLGTVVLTKYWGESWGVFCSLVVLMAMFMVIGKIIPEVLGQKYATQISSFIRVILLFRYLFYPLTKSWVALKQFAQKLMGIEKSLAEERKFTEEEIINMVASG